jgi:hypothetical protein
VGAVGKEDFIDRMAEEFDQSYTRSIDELLPHPREA